jgi:peptidoglycan/LPS O-acetylase OafA/YrhL
LLKNYNNIYEVGFKALTQFDVSRIKYLDGWRGCAILGVLVGHFLSPPWINTARFGVELFFVLSGRLMAQILFTKGVPLRQFFGRRVSRIYPALLVMVGVIAIVDPRATSAQVAVSLTFLANYVSVDGTGALSHVWSLCVEEHMYILLAIIAAFHRKFGFSPSVALSLVAAAMVVNGVVQTISGGNYYEVYWRTDTRGASILFGAIAYLVIEVRNLKIKPFVPIILGFIAIALNSNPIPDPVKYSFGTASLAISLSMIPKTFGIVRKALEWPALTTIGLASYSLYLWQQPFYIANGSGRIGILPAVIASLVFGAMSYKFIEGPVRRRINAWVG